MLTQAASLLWCCLLAHAHAVQHACVQAQAASQAKLRAVQAELQGATEMLDSMQQMASSSMQGQEEAQKQMDALTSQLQAAIQVHVSPQYEPLCCGHKSPCKGGKRGCNCISPAAMF